MDSKTSTTELLLLSMAQTILVLLLLQHHLAVEAEYVKYKEIKVLIDNLNFASR